MQRLLLILFLFVFLVSVNARPLAPGVLSWPAGSCEIHWYVGRTLVGVCPGQVYDVSTDETQRLVLQAVALLVIVTFVVVSLPAWRKSSN